MVRIRRRLHLQLLLLQLRNSSLSTWHQYMHWNFQNGMTGIVSMHFLPDTIISLAIVFGKDEEVVEGAQQKKMRDYC